MDIFFNLSINTLRPRQNGHHFQNTFSNEILFNENVWFSIQIFHWSLFLRVQLKIFQHWFRKRFGTDQATNHYLNQWWLDYWRIYASLVLNELTHCGLVTSCGIDLGQHWIKLWLLGWCHQAITWTNIDLPSKVFSGIHLRAIHNCPWTLSMGCVWRLHIVKLLLYLPGANVLTLNMRGPSYLGLTRSISWLLMPWLLTSPGHQQPWYWLYRIGKFWSYLRKDLDYLRGINVEKWHKM